MASAAVQARHRCAAPCDRRREREGRIVVVFDVAGIVEALHAVRHQWREEQKRSLDPGGRELPAREALAEVVDALKGVLFPMRLGPPDLRKETEDFYVGHALNAALHALCAQA